MSMSNGLAIGRICFLSLAIFHLTVYGPGSGTTKPSNGGTGRM
ncbi:MAG TPA: hypothetical protein VFU49_11370 [Ktedonobacteraceae bacterium]|nr:hypothetical protein [Ktedonobacteraceae bacterium]